jgi:hypothetical protein
MSLEGIGGPEPQYVVEIREFLELPNSGRSPLVYLKLAEDMPLVGAGPDGLGLAENQDSLKQVLNSSTKINGYIVPTPLTPFQREYDFEDRMAMATESDDGYNTEAIVAMFENPGLTTLPHFHVNLQMGDGIAPHRLLAGVSEEIDREHLVTLRYAEYKVGWLEKIKNSVGGSYERFIGDNFQMSVDDFERAYRASEAWLIQQMRGSLVDFVRSLGCGLLMEVPVEEQVEGGVVLRTYTNKQGNSYNVILF